MPKTQEEKLSYVSFGDFTDELDTSVDEFRRALADDDVIDDIQEQLTKKANNRAKK